MEVKSPFDSIIDNNIFERKTEMQLLMVLLSWTISGLILIIALYYLTGGFVFTAMRDNTYKAIVTNGRLVRLISNVEPLTIEGLDESGAKVFIQVPREIDQSDRRLKLVTAILPENREPFLKIGDWEWERKLYDLMGLRWVGWPIFRQVLTIPINRVVWKEKKNEVPTILGRIKVSTKNTKELYQSFPRPIEMKEVDTNDGFRLDLSLLAFIEVYAPYFAFFKLKDAFMSTLDSMIEAYVQSVLKGLSWEEFKLKKEAVDEEVAAGTTNPGKVLFNFTDLAKRMELAGSMVSGLIIDDFGISASSVELQEAVEKQKIAEEEGKAAEKTAEYGKRATIKTAEGAKQKRKLEGEGEAAAIEAIAKAKAKRYDELITLYVRMGFDKRTAAEKADEQIFGEFKWDAVGKLPGTYVENGNAVQPTLPLGGRKDK